MTMVPFRIPRALIAVCALATLMVLPMAAQAEDWVPEPGSSADYTARMWKAYQAQDLDDAMKIIDECVKKCGATAATQEASLTSPPPANEAKEVTAARGPLNDVGVCMMVKGDILLKKGDQAGAKAAYAKVINDYKYARCWDPKGWFWSPADAAKKKLTELGIDE
jgi:predicted negative regulator of RcsB-dependent stress response